MLLWFLLLWLFWLLCWTIRRLVGWFLWWTGTLLLNLIRNRICSGRINLIRYRRITLIRSERRRSHLFTACLGWVLLTRLLTACLGWVLLTCLSDRLLAAKGGFDGRQNREILTFKKLSNCAARQFVENFERVVNSQAKAKYVVSIARLKIGGQVKVLVTLVYVWGHYCEWGQRA